MQHNKYAKTNCTPQIDEISATARQIDGAFATDCQQSVAHCVVLALKKVAWDRGRARLQRAR